MAQHPKNFVEALETAGVTFYAGVPDSLLKDLLAYIEANIPRERHITAANEGNAVGIATGYHLATGKLACVYLQNSGLGNAVNPLTSLVDKEVYSIPMLLVIGWRGEPGVKDEPQHLKQGRITPALLDVLEIPHTDKLEKVGVLIEQAKKESRPVALIVHADSFEAYVAPKAASAPGSMTREAAIEEIIAHVNPKAIVVSTTGKISRELYEARKRRGEQVRDFLTVGSMGHASQIALGIAVQKLGRSVVCLDGDGAAIMHLGSLSTVGWVKPKNFLHIVLNNKAHESVGGQKSAAEFIDLPAIAKANGYADVARVTTKEELVTALKARPACPAFLEVVVNLDSRKDLMRPAETPQENKKAFMDFIDAN
jgi:phosphonopyruvate decarboxylase